MSLIKNPIDLSAIHYSKKNPFNFPLLKRIDRFARLAKQYLAIFSLIMATLLVPAFLRAETTILFLGDSLTAGYGVDKAEAFPQLVHESLLASGFSQIQVVNGGFSGSTTASALQRLRWYMKLKPDILVLELGANDGLRGQPLPSIKNNLAQVIRFAQENKIVPVLAGMKLPINYGTDYTSGFENLFRSLAEEYSIAFIPFLLDNVAGNPALNLADGIHPNPAGHKIIAATVVNHLRPLLSH